MTSELHIGKFIIVLSYYFINYFNNLMGGNSD